MPTRRINQGQPPEQAGMLFVGGYGILWPSKRSPVPVMSAATASEHFEGHTPSHPPQKGYPLAQDIVPYRSDASDQDERPLVGL